jgi:hypothetical protein
MLTADELAALDAEAELSGVSRGDVCRSALRGRVAPLAGTRRMA